MKSAQRKKQAPNSWRQVRELFERVEDLNSAKRREYYSAEKTPKSFVAEIESLLSLKDPTETFLEQPAVLVFSDFAKKSAKKVRLPSGSVIDDFRIKRPIGEGALATVYLAEQISLNREVALKVSASSHEEARVLATLEHDHIVKVFSESFHKKKGVALVCMQFVPGASLDRIMREMGGNGKKCNGSDLLSISQNQSPVPIALNSTALEERELLAKKTLPESILWIGICLADALEYAHSRGVLHLDVKPSNIILSPYGRPMLADFNVSVKQQGPSTEIPEHFGGTFPYMPPEQRAVFESENKVESFSKVDKRADVYSLGYVLKELLLKELTQISGEEKLATLSEMEYVLNKACNPDVEKRFQSAGEMKNALQTCLELFDVRKNLPPVQRMTRMGEKFPLTALTLIGAVPQLIASIIGLLYNRTRIVSYLSYEQRHLFEQLNYYYLPFVYALGGVIWVLLVVRLQPFLSAPASIAQDSRRLTSLRNHALRLPYWGLIITSLGWLPTAIIFPCALHYYGKSLTPATFFHFCVSFHLSWIIAASYSYLLHQWLVIRTLYPKFWWGSQQLGATAGLELRRVSPLTNLFVALTVITPLSAAVLLLATVGSDSLSPNQFQTFKILCMMLIGLGAFGVFFASWIRNQIQTSLNAFRKINTR